ncbi:restriction endonuclease subunit S [Flavobacterium sp. AG291]|uniref:restriction endonuclease subunit S n=1 Tax=Flavobacterium sp. AG291 TaxID=2184000 RepID=UPI000E0C3F98|nr:restriction endonuclease subunit S [Flavobacterium sp. AG291]RDI06684.1 restriction endonuclease S subunit [Flavobacterium sp. AG291]
MKDWKKVKLGEILTLSKVVSESPDPKKRIRVKLNNGGVEKRPYANDKEGATRYYIRKSGQFIYGSQNLHKGAFGIVPTELDGYESSQDIPAFDVSDSCYVEWIYYFFRQGNFYLKLEGLAKGVGSKRINPNQLLEISVYLPPKIEQKRILESINDFEKKSIIVEHEIKHQLDLIDKLYTTTLQDAITGKLTSEWRENNNIQEDGNFLLKKFIQKKQDLIEQKIIVKQLPLPKIKDSERPFVLPSTWTWARMGDISLKLGAGSTPTGGKSVYINKGIKFFRSQNIYNDGVKTDDIAYISPTIHEKMKGSQVKPKDILLNITGGSIGRCALIADDFDEGNVSQHVAIIRLLDLNIREYIHYLIISHYFQETIMNVQVGVSREGLSMASLKMIKIPLPPLKEIFKIVKYLNDFENSYIRLKEIGSKRKEEFETLKHTVLREAFGNINIEIDNMARKPKPSSGSFHPNLVNTLGNYTRSENLVEIEDLLKEYGKMSALSLWKMSKHEKDIDEFYEDLKLKVEISNIIKESDEKGFLELVK